MKVSHKWLQTYFKDKIPSAEKLAELFPMHSFEVEGIEEVGDDFAIDVKILPDRAHYALSHKGIADEIYFITKMLPNSRFAGAIKSDTDKKPRVEIKDSRFCRRYIARYVEFGGLTSEGRPPRVDLVLGSIGQRSINPIVDATNYVMYDIGQPLHAFDADKVKGAIVIRAAKEGEKITLLDDREIALTANDYVIADDEGPLVIAGVKGGRRAEISATTSRIIIESANFEPTLVRKTSTKYDIRSDSSKRFENEITPELAIHGMNNVCALIKEMYPGAKFGPIVDEYPVKSKQTVINFDPACLEERLGIQIPLNEAEKILFMMGIRVEHESSKWVLTIPYERLDLTIKEDIVEEVGRIYGYDKIKGALPAEIGKDPAVLPMFYVSEKIKNILAREGCSEVMLYSLVEKGEIEMAKPLAKDKAFARTNLADEMMESLKKNGLNADLLGLEAIKIFEIGHVFGKDSEEVCLAIGAVQVKKVKGIKGETIIKSLVEKLEEEFGVGEIKYKISSEGAYSVAEIRMDDIVRALESRLTSDTSYKDLDFGPASANRYKRFSQYPFIVRDIAVFTPESVDATGVWNVIEKGLSEADASDLVARRSLFDVFKKDGKVSYAFRIVFQSMERTLNDEEVNKVMEKINAAVKGKRWEVR